MTKKPKDEQAQGRTDLGMNNGCVYHCADRIS